MRKITVSRIGAPKKSSEGNEEDDETDFLLVGRAQEKVQVEEILVKLKGEEPFNSIVAVQGEPGIGKSRLLDYVLKRGDRMGVQGLHGFALDTEFTTCVAAASAAPPGSSPPACPGRSSRGNPWWCSWSRWR
jgi:hypothetical protein